MGGGGGVLGVDTFNRRHGEIADDVESACSPIPKWTQPGIEYQEVSVAEVKELGTLISPRVPVCEGVELWVVMCCSLAVPARNVLRQRAPVTRRQVAEVKASRTDVFRAFGYRDVLERAVRKDRSQRAPTPRVDANSEK